MNGIKILCFVVVVIAALQVSASDICKRNFTLGVGEDQLRQKTGQKAVVGLATEFVKEIKDRVDCIYTDVPTSPERAITELKNFRLDLYAFAFSNERFKDFADQEVIYSTNRILLVDKKNYKPSLKIQDYLKNPKIKFSAISGSAYLYGTEEIKALADQNRMSYNSQMNGSVDSLVRKKVQATFISPAFLKQQIERTNLLKDAVAIPDPNYRLHIVLLISKKRVSFKERQQFAKAIADMRQEGVIEKILLHYVSTEDLKAYYKF